ncbi:MAG: CocE/NonD family hydrolase [Terriglobales bacterium]
MCKTINVVVLCITVACFANAQQFDFPEPTSGDPATLAKPMSGLAKQLIDTYKENDRGVYLDNLFRLQMVAGDYARALQSLSELRMRRWPDPARAAWVNVQHEIFAAAKLKEMSDKLPFEEAFKRSFREKFAQLDNQTSALVIRALAVEVEYLQGSLQRDLDAQKGKSSISAVDALKLVRDYQVAEAFRSFAPLTAPVTLSSSPWPTTQAAPLIVEDDARRYIIEKDVPVKMPDGGIICALIVRPRNAPARLPALLEFTIYADPDDNLRFGARPAAAHGYVGIEGLVRGKGCSPDKPVPYEHDASDIAALIDWISVQPWSDGRVGMYGGSYSGGAGWAATKHMPKALKAIDVGAPVAPGLDVPMEGNVFWNFIYSWPFYTTDLKGDDDKVYSDRGRWGKLNHDWYASGRAYRDLEKIDGTPNPIFDTWISHPSYDAYWQSLIPYQEEFARINIPVLQTAGYFYGGPGAATYYFAQHYRYNPKAEHYLVIGPYDHLGAQHGTVGLLGQDFRETSGYKLDPLALIDLEALRFEWFDHILKGAPMPELLQDKVNYEVTGANAWKHAPSLAAMADHSLPLHFTAQKSGGAYVLSREPAAGESSVSLAVDYADRKDVDRKMLGGGVLDKDVDTWNGVEFISDPLASATELSGLFSGHLDFISNKKDFDFEVDVYEQTPKGEYMQLSEYWTRASYARAYASDDRSHRRLLVPNERTRLDFISGRLMSRQLQSGSRVVIVVTLVKDPGREINYGSGKEVSAETIEDTKEPTRVQLFNDSYVDLPVGK